MRPPPFATITLLPCSQIVEHTMMILKPHTITTHLHKKFDFEWVERHGQNIGFHHPCAPVREDDCRVGRECLQISGHGGVGADGCRILQHAHWRPLQVLFQKYLRRRVAYRTPNRESR